MSSKTLPPFMQPPPMNHCPHDHSELVLVKTDGEGFDVYPYMACTLCSYTESCPEPEDLPGGRSYSSQVYHEAFHNL